MRKKKRSRIAILLFIIISLVIANIIFDLVLYNKVKHLGESQEHNSTLPFALPAHLLYENYDCVNQLIHAMNISNVYIISPDEI